MHTFPVRTSDMGEAVVTVNARSIKLTYNDETIAFALNFVVPTNCTEEHYENAYSMVLSVLKAHHIETPQTVASRIISIL